MVYKSVDIVDNFRKCLVYAQLKGVFSTLTVDKLVNWGIKPVENTK